MKTTTLIVCMNQPHNSRGYGLKNLDGRMNAL